MGAGAWVREYGVQIETVASDLGLETLLATADATAVDFAAAKIGVTGDGTANGKFKLLLENKPDIIPTTAVVESDVASGVADKTEEDIQATVSQPVGFAPEMKCNAYLASLFFSLFSQNGYTELTPVSNIVVGKAVPYTNIDITRYAAFLGVVQKLGGTKDQCELTRGALPSTIKLSAEEGGILMLNAEIMGAKWSKDFSLPGAYATTGVPTKVPFLKWQNATVLIDNSYNTPADPTSGLKTLSDGTGTRFFMQGFELNLANGLQAKFYNNETIQTFVLQKYTAEGSFVVPWVVPTIGGATAIAQKYYWDQIQDFRDGIVKHVRIQWGTWSGSDATATDNAFLIDMYIKYKTGTLEGDDVLGSNMGYTCVQPIAGTPSITVRFGYKNTGTNALVRV
jgi:hypothetical protein